MLHEKRLASNVLRRIFHDAQYNATQLRAQASGFSASGDGDTATALLQDAREEDQISRTACSELKSRGEALN